jgi:hypothetical protein
MSAEPEDEGIFWRRSISGLLSLQRLSAREKLDPISQASPRVALRFMARMVAVGYLVLMLSGFDLFHVVGKIVVRGDASAGELALVLWLLLKGVDERRWHDQAAAAGRSVLYE